MNYLTIKFVPVILSFPSQALFQYENYIVYLLYSSLFTSILASLTENLSEDKYLELIRMIEQYFHVILSQSEIFYSSFIAALFNATLYKSR